VVEKTEKIEVIFSDEREFKAEIVGRDPKVKTDAVLFYLNLYPLPTDSTPGDQTSAGQNTQTGDHKVRPYARPPGILGVRY